MKLLAELDLLRDRKIAGSQSDEALDITSMSSSGSGEDCGIIGAEEPILRAVISSTELAKDNRNQQFAVYDIHVSHQSENGEIFAEWSVLRRYSDFNEMHNLIERTFPHLADYLKFPAKRTFNNLSKDFLETRQKQLNVYLESLLIPDIIKHNPGLKQIVGNFLNKGTFDKRKGIVPRKETSNFMSPFLSGVVNGKCCDLHAGHPCGRHVCDG